MITRPTHAPSQQVRYARAFTLIEVLAASAVLAVGMTAAVSLTSSMMVQEELSARVAVTRNYQENMARLWQLGLSTSVVSSVLPIQTDSALLNQSINGTPMLVDLGTTDIGGLGTMEVAAVTAAVNISGDPKTEKQGASFSLPVYRPSLPTQLRIPAR